MLGTPLLLTFRLLHILAGAFWFGGVVVAARFVFPSALAIGPAGAPFMDQLGRVRKLPLNLLSAGIVAVLTGFVLFRHDSVVAGGAFEGSMMGRALGVGALLSLIALVIGFTVNLPTVKRINALSMAIQAQGTPASAEQQAQMRSLQMRLLTALRVVALLLLLATASMAIARYIV